uniref:Tr-type G domain-containing protein n=1 Tax=Chromera velia CCMP2878 TaxID=1169474 RepID=A0A0G4F625_9ALVE|eukprot:Cvel_15370.t1-p1 / transcript=Cvel_15370.t1 / gene=Cvel_15370 / organism=Chromera_velia_CCMP2878 / gene_product=Selenocysteine-specific elongation factor, putative / transcript_product=Selenocysteine-specific elongation factor, putative / location=Cvel_scaffold1133:16199-20969(-) / protein_length=723 / sequence_SO=supercontig / SO=protein_coding / is_pseudo=false
MSEGEDKPMRNVNVGVLGHIDSGKTSLVRALSQVTSTASLDKHPQSQERGITLDLGFTAFALDTPPEKLAPSGEPVGRLQICLVDCPGHASLMKTVIGGAQIIDAVLLVVDATKGIQTQTAECLVLAEILAPQIFVVLNKIDLFPKETRQKKIDTLISRLQKVFAKTNFGSDVPFIPVAASPSSSGGEAAGTAATATAGSSQTQEGGANSEGADKEGNEPSAPSGQPDVDGIGIGDLKRVLAERVRIPSRDRTGPLWFAFDHAFSLKGKGTIVTGTVVSGSLQVGASVESALGGAGGGGKVRTIQMFKRNVNEAIQGDRCAINVPQMDASKLERGVLVSPASAPAPARAVVAAVQKIHYFKHPVLSKQKFHVTIGHTTTMASFIFFVPHSKGGGKESRELNGEGKKGSETGDTATSEGSSAVPSHACSLALGGLVSREASRWPSSFPLGDEGEASGNEKGRGKPQQSNRNFDWLEELLSPQQSQQTATGGATSNGAGSHSDKQTGESSNPFAFAVILFERPVQVPQGSLLIASKLDADVHSPSCRLALFGKTLSGPLPMGSAGEKEKDKCAEFGKLLRVLKRKERVGVVERVENDEYSAICKGMFKKETDITLFAGLKVVHRRSGTSGVIEGPFGKSGKFRVRFDAKVGAADSSSSAGAGQAGKAGGKGKGRGKSSKDANGAAEEEGADPNIEQEGGQEKERDAVVLVYYKNVFDKSVRFIQD